MALTCFAKLLCGQCMVDNPGGSKLNPNRPADADVPVASFSPLKAVNAALPRWLCFTAGYRARVEGYTAGNFQEGNSDAYLLTRFRLGLAIRPASWLRSYIELQDATAFWKDPPLAPPYQSTWDLRRGYIDLGDIDNSVLSLRVGRQDLAFGWLRLVGTSYWRNASRGYDAAMLTVNSSLVRVNAWVAAPVVPGDNGLSHHQAGNDFHGIYSSWRKLVPSALVEPYALWHLTRGLRPESGGIDKLNEKTFGLRWAGSVRAWDYDLEAARQTGSLGHDRIRAWGWSAILGYTIPSARHKTRIFAKYDFASGDRNPHDGVRGTFDQLYPNIHDHHGLADQVAWQNLDSIRAGLRMSLRRNWMFSSAFNDWRLASAKDAFYNASGAAVARDTTGASGTHIGSEFDVQTSYRFDRQLEIGAGVGHIRSGEFLTRTGHAPGYTYPYFMVNYSLN